MEAKEPLKLPCIPPARCKPRAALAIVLLAWLPGCNTPDSVAKFCSSAVVTLKSGDALFDDMKATCVREAQTRESFGAFSMSDPSFADCDEIGRKAEDLKTVSALVTKYFTALNDLASFGKTKAGDDGKSKTADDSNDEATNASAPAQRSDAQQKALESVAGFLTHVAMSGYQQKHLADDIVSVHQDIKVVLDGLGEAAGVVYLHLLQDEEHKTVTRYQEFLLQHPGDAGATLALDFRWQADRASFAAKQKAAQSYRAALETMAKGNDELAAHARGFKTSELSALLSPYAAELESLAPAIQKAFF